jgi:hypothetical protein
MLRLLLLTVAVGVAVSVPTDKDTLGVLFSKFMREHGKEYASREEFLHRQKIFAKNLQKIEEHNRSGSSYKMGKKLNQRISGDLRRKDDFWSPWNVTKKPVTGKVCMANSKSPGGDLSCPTLVFITFILVSFYDDDMLPFFFRSLYSLGSILHLFYI